MRGSETLVDMNDWVLTRFELLSLAANKWVVNVVVSIMARMLSIFGDHRYFDTTFRERYHVGILC